MLNLNLMAVLNFKMVLNVFNHCEYNYRLRELFKKRYLFVMSEMNENVFTVKKSGFPIGYP